MTQRRRRRRRLRKRRTQKKKVQQNLLFWSSLVFVTNMWTAFFTQQYLYSFFFGSLTISSLMVHSYPTIWTNLWDKLWILSIVFYGGARLYSRRYTAALWKLTLCVLTFLFCVWVYAYGYITSQFCFDPVCSEQYHALMHAVSSFGHHCIIFL